MLEKENCIRCDKMPVCKNIFDRISTIVRYEGGDLKKIEQAYSETAKGCDFFAVGLYKPKK